ncbi:prepilin peptidase, partial [Patescibacteria group bacterium]
SYCPKCKHKLVWFDNIPLVSWLLLKGRCRYCNDKISLQYPFVELSTGVLFVLAFVKTRLMVLNFPVYHLFEGKAYRFTTSTYLLLFSYFFFISVLIIIFVYDLKWYLILDKITIPSIVAAGVLNVILGHSILNLLLAGFIVGGFFLFQFIISRGKWIGGGDIRLGFLMGIILGWPIAIVALFISYILGAIVGIGLIVTGKKKMSSQVPFGTFLSVGAIIALLYGQELLRWYMQILL